MGGNAVVATVTPIGITRCVGIIITIFTVIMILDLLDALKSPSSNPTLPY